MITFAGMDKNETNEKEGSTSNKNAEGKNADGSSDRDEHGPPIERVPGPGPKDAGKGAMGKEAKDRLERKQ
jgi:hypothetical protein